MPKLKTNKSAKKRFKITKTGKVMRSKAGRRHLLTSKSSGHKRRSRKYILIQDEAMRVVKKLMPYD